MITIEDVLTWLKIKMPDIPAWGMGFIDKSKAEVVGVYARRHGRIQPLPVGHPSSYGLKAVTLLIHWGKTFPACEEKALAFWEMFQKCHTQETIGGMSCWIEATQLPVVVGKDDNGFFEAVVDFDIYARRKD